MKRYFPYLLLWTLICGALFSAEEEKDKEDRYRFRFRGLTNPIERKGQPPRPSEEHGPHGLSQNEMVERQKQVTEFWNERKKSGGEITKADVVKLYGTAKDFSVVHSLLGSVISADDSRAIGRLRAEIHAEVLESLAKSKRFGTHMGVNDFGSGADLSTVDAKTDIDFTLYNKLGAAGTEMVNAYKQEFRRITGQYGSAVDPGQCDIVAHRYEATIPDWRQGTDLAMFETKIRTGLDLLRSNPEAYFLEGAYMQQVMKRSVDPKAKTFTWYELDENNNLVKRTESAALQKEYFFHPETKARYAFGGAVGNWHFFHAHGGDQVARAKYILRSMDDGVGMLHQDSKKGDFEKMSPSDQEAFVKQIYSGKFSPNLVNGILATLKTSINMRQLKKDKKLDMRSTEGLIEAYRPLVDHLRAENPGVEISNEELVKMAEQNFNKLGNAVLIENNIQSSTSRLNDWLKPSIKTGDKIEAVDESGNPKTYQIDPSTITKLQYSAFFELYSALSLMDEGLINRIKEANPRFKGDIDILEGIIKKKKEMMSAPEGMKPEESLDFRKQKAAEVQAEIQRLKGVLQSKGYSAAAFEGMKSGWDAGQRFENWMQNAAIDSLVKLSGGKNYIPVLKKMRAEVERTNQEGLGPKWMARLDKANSLVEVLKAYAREGKINDKVLEVAFYETLSFVPGVGTLYSLQGGLQGASMLVLTNVIPGYGQIVLVVNLVKGTVELGGLMVFEPLKRDKILLAYQGYLEKEEGGWFFSSGQKERVESPRPPLLYPVDPDGKLPLDERRAKMYHYLHNQVVSRMKANPDIWYEEQEYPQDWQNEEFKELKKLVTEYVNHWWEGTGPFGEFDVLTVHRGPDIREDLNYMLIQDYIRGKQIALQKMIKEREEKEEGLLNQFMDIASSEYALENGEENFRGDYQSAAELFPAAALDGMPAIEPSIEILAAQNFEELEKADKAKETISERVNLRAKINASFKDHPGPWSVEWTLENDKSGKVDFTEGDHEEVEARTGTVTVIATAKDANGKEIATARYPLSVEKVKIEEGKKDDEPEGDDLSQAVDDVSALLEKLKAAAALADALNKETRENCNSSKEKAETASKKIEAAESKVTEIGSRIDALKGELEKLLAAIKDAVKQSEEIDSIGKQIALIRDRVEETALKICEKARDIGDAPSTKKQKERLEELLKLREEITGDLKSGEALLEKAKKLAAALSDLSSRMKAFEESVQKVQRELETSDPESQESKGEVQGSQTDLGAAQGKVSELKGVHGEGGALLREGEAILKPFKDKSEKAKNLIQEMQGLFGTIQKLKDSVENCPEEISTTVDETANKQSTLENKLAETKESLNQLQQGWKDSNAVSSLEEAKSDTEAAMAIIEIYWETIQDRIKDSEVCENLGKNAAERPPKLRVPDVRGKNLIDAQKIVDDAELKSNPVGGNPAPKKEFSFTVESQSPSPGAEAKPGDEVTLQIYGEFKEMKTVPNVIGLPAEEAMNRVSAAGLTPNPAGGDPAPEEKLSFKVYALDPPAGEKVEGGAKISVIIYGAYVPAPLYIVPKVVGMDKEAADVELSGKGFAPAGKEGDPAPSKEEEGKVFTQDPQPGAEFKEKGAAVSFTYYGKVKVEEQDPSQAPPAEEKRPYIVVCKLYMPQPIGKPPKEPELVEAWYQRLTLSQVRFTVQKEMLFLSMTGEALNKYPIEFFTPGKKISTTLTISGQFSGGPIAIDGAILLEVHRASADLNAIQQEFPKTKDPNAVFLFATADGKFKMTFAAEGGSATITGGPIVDGWPQAMKEKALDLFKKLVIMFKCFIATAVYDFHYTPELDALRKFRDVVMASRESGLHLTQKYYRFGPSWALYIQQNPGMKPLLRPFVDLAAKVVETVDWSHPAAKFTINTLMDAADSLWSWWLGQNVLMEEEINEKAISSDNSAFAVPSNP